MTPLPPPTSLTFLAQTAYHYTQPFIQPLPLWDQWYLWLFPLTAAIAIVYKSIRCNSMRRVPREAAVLCLVILIVLILAAAALAAIVKGIEYSAN